MAVAVALAAGATYLGVHLVGGALWLAAAGLVVLFFEFRPRVPPEPNALVAPVSGSVQRTDSVEDPWGARRALRIRVRPTWPGVSELRSPTEGKVTGYWVAPRAFDADGVASGRGESPNCYALGVTTDEGDEVVMAVSSLRPVSRMKLQSSPGERVGQGLRAGFVYFASHVDVLVPTSSRVDVTEGERVRAGESVLAELVRD